VAYRMTPSPMTLSDLEGHFNSTLHIAHAMFVYTRTPPPVDAALIPATTPSQPMCAVETRAPLPLSVCCWLADHVTRHRPTGQPVSITGQPATPTTDSPCVTVTDTCGFNSSIDMNRKAYVACRLISTVV